MKVKKLLIVCTALIALSSCVTSKKYNQVNAAFLKTRADQKNCEDTLHALTINKSKLQGTITDLQVQADDLKKQLDVATSNGAKALSALNDLSSTSKEEANSVKKTTESLNKKTAYIQGLQSFVAQRDSLNRVLAKALSDSLSGTNNQFINIKVEKNEVRIDISDSLLFINNTFALTDSARKVLGKIAQVLHTNADMNLRVESHTDTTLINTDCLEDNWDLSGKRAAAVVRLLQTQYALNPEKLCATGNGEYVPGALISDDNAYAYTPGTRIVVSPQFDDFFNLFSKR